MVYVDSFYSNLGRMVMCHMVADSLNELHEMADKLGVRVHFQNGTKYPHYDICKSNRAKAIKLGAIECDRKTLITKAKQLKTELEASSELISV